MNDTITTDPANGKPTHGDPRFHDRTVYDAVCTDPGGIEAASASWDLGYGATLSFGPEEDGGPLTVTLNLSDYTLATGHLVRTVTRAQLVAHAEHLLRIAGARTGIVLDEVAR